jgi:hypothetical protein
MNRPCCSLQSSRAFRLSLSAIDDYDELVKFQTFVKILVEPLSTHAFATKQIRQGKRGQSIVDVRQAISSDSADSITRRLSERRKWIGGGGPETGSAHAGLG